MVKDMLDSHLSEIEKLYPSAQELIGLFPIPAVIVHRSNIILFVNQQFADIYYYATQEMIGKKISSFSENAGQMIEEYFDSLDKGGSLSVEDIYINGFYYQILIHPIYGSKKSVEAIFCFQWNISKIKRLQQVFNQNNKRYKEQLYLDQMTKIANEYALENYISELKQQNKYNKVTTMILDIDNFGEFNKEHGFVKANETLLLIAQTLKQELRKENDFLVKLNSDRFLIILPDASHYSSLTIAERLKNSIYHLNLSHHAGIDHRLTISIVLHEVLLSELVINKLIHSLGYQLNMSKITDGRNQSSIYTLKNK